MERASWRTEAALVHHALGDAEAAEDWERERYLDVLDGLQENGVDGNGEVEKAVNERVRALCALPEALADPGTPERPPAAPGEVEAWLARAHPIGTRITVHSTRDEKVSGRFDGLEPDGALRLAVEGGALEVVRAGDVEL